MTRKKEIRKSCETCGHMKKLSNTEYEERRKVEREPARPIHVTKESYHGNLHYPHAICLKFNDDLVFLFDDCDSWEAKSK